MQIEMKHMLETEAALLGEKIDEIKRTAKDGQLQLCIIFGC